MFSDFHRQRAARLGVDLDASYKRFLTEIRVGGPAYQRLCDSLDGRHRKNYASGTVSVVVSRTKGLSARECEVLGLCASGLTGGEIAKALWLSEETVRSHVSKIRWKLGARNTAHAVAIGITRGLIGLEAAA